jgi:ABC-type antimicrobial peptide transport system permease subunit
MVWPESRVKARLGAQRRDVVWEMLRRAVRWIAAGVAAGIPVALSAARGAQSLLFGLSAGDARVLIGAASVMAAMGLLAAYLPARRASRVDPLTALRCE